MLLNVNILNLFSRMKLLLDQNISRKILPNILLAYPDSMH